ncbi:hypothetical protein HHL19_35785 [Streptomyces sp. R302]|uniref:hypothetical protein n=1 Tax=unclassified Streptomyces TaxID=2593676 RepID=UPI00145D1DF4|nr:MULTISPECIES: hypothetical protein [unclassified Streptomyces]NML55098.1 hypothetical protein [Streptomyces sp. R301]NML83872.1 hypothetical protein [Streptomyces sp. R302]
MAKRHSTDLRNRTRAHRAAARARRATLIAAHRVRTGARSLTTHVLAVGLPSEDAKSMVDTLRKHAKKNAIKGRRARSRRTSDGFLRKATTVYRYTREQVAAIVATYKPRKPAFKAARAALAAA